MGSIAQLLPDRYELNARLKPALLLLLPPLVVALAWVPKLTTLGGGVATVAASCGITYLLSQIARKLGRDLEQSWGDQIGRRQSARLLSHNDKTIRGNVKARIIDLVTEFGPGVPSEEEENANPGDAEDRRLDAVEWLLEATRANAESSLLLSENIAYGFWRNLRALKPLGLCIAIAAGVVDAWLLYRTDILDARYFWGVAAGVFCLLAIFAWMLVVTKHQVRDAALTYAKRLFAQADNPAVRVRLADAQSPLKSAKKKPARKKNAASPASADGHKSA